MKTPTEIKMWEKAPRIKPIKLTDAQINEKYTAGDDRIVTETNIEKLPNFYEAMNRPKYLEIRPFYQRRSRWDEERQSKLIESFIMNIPVPPIFLYEKEFNQYEVMDGQQRITAIKNFYDNNLILKGLERWPELNGRSYKQLPSKIKAGIDRRTITSIVLLKESMMQNEDAMFLRQTVFERLNTGGVKLERQEIRNSLCSGKLNQLLYILARNDIFRNAWDLPTYSEEEDNEDASKRQPIHDEELYCKMQDLELVLRFFALRHAEHYSNGMQGFLDTYMIKSMLFTDRDIKILEDIFTKTIKTAHAIYDKLLFKPYMTTKEKWAPKAQKAYYDCVMVSISNLLEHSDVLITKRREVIKATKNLFISNEDGTFTGRGNTKSDILNRISLFTNMLTSII